MFWCRSCLTNISRPLYHEDKICYSSCGRVVDDDNFSQEATFVKNASGQSQLSGNYVKTIQNEYSLSRTRILDEVDADIRAMMTAIEIDGGDSIARPAFRFFTIAVERGFTWGRRKKLVVAACLYISCRENKKRYLLIDFAEHLRINVYVLGAVFLQLCKLLSLEEHPIVQKPVDPSIFIRRFADRLFGGSKLDVSKTALRIIASMKRDWMQTGRKPSGLCGAALYISALSFGIPCSKSNVIKVVHLCEATLTKRLIEFENTESGSLTIDEFILRADELEKEERSIIKPVDAGSRASTSRELLCEHKASGTPHFAHGLCESCYADFIKLSGGLDGGLDPPAFQRAENERLMAKETIADIPEDMDPTTLPFPMSDKTRNIKNMNEYEDLESPDSSLTGNTLGSKVDFDSFTGNAQEFDFLAKESETFSDIDDDEVDCYLHNEEEKKFKKIIWEEMNKEYLEEQAAKEAAKEADEARLANCSDNERAAKKLSAAATEAAAKARKEKREKRAAELKNLAPPKTAAEATKQMLNRKGLSSKINYDELYALFGESVDSEVPKKRRKEAESEYDENSLNKSIEDDVIKNTEDNYPEYVEQDDYCEEYNYFDDF